MSRILCLITIASISCAINPYSGKQIPDHTVAFAGFTDEPGTTVQLAAYAWSSATFVTIGQTTSATVPTFAAGAICPNSPALYAYSSSISVDWPGYWQQIPSGAYQTKVRAGTARLLSSFTDNPAGDQCMVAHAFNTTCDFYDVAANVCGYRLLDATIVSTGPLRTATPPMGWSSWNSFACNVTEDDVKQQAQAMVDRGMLAVGYKYVNIDDCWQASQRNADGTLPSDPIRFSHGIKALADFVHLRDLKLGIYSSPNVETCTLNPGSANHETIDAQQFASWGVDYVKYDRCDLATGVDAAFTRMRTALDATGRWIVYSINPQGAVSTMQWSSIADLWRTTPDIKAIWSGDGGWWRGMIDIADLDVEWTRFGKKGAWNDPDMLEVGVTGGGGFPGLGWSEQRVHMSLWAIMAAPLIAGANLVTISDQTMALMTNPEVIAVDQDPTGTPGWRVRDEGDREVWMRRLQQPGARAVALVNRSWSLQVINVPFAELQLDAGVAATVRDLWAHQDLGMATSLSVIVYPHDVAFLRVVGKDRFNMAEAESVLNERVGGASPASCPTCSGALKLGQLGNGGVVRMPFYAASSGSTSLTIYYLSDGARNLTIRANANPPATYSLPSTGSFQTVGSYQLYVTLTAGWNNTLELSSSTGWAPDIDRIVAN